MKTGVPGKKAAQCMKALGKCMRIPRPEKMNINDLRINRKLPTDAKPGEALCSNTRYFLVGYDEKEMRYLLINMRNGYVIRKATNMTELLNGFDGLRVARELIVK